MPQPIIPISEGREVLVNFGNRYVVFAEHGRLPGKSFFDPERDSEVLPRVGNEYEGAEQRAIETLKIEGLTRAATPSLEAADIEFTDANGTKLLLDIKVRDRPARDSDFKHGFETARELTTAQAQFETWFFNIERLELTILRSIDLPRPEPRVAINVFERTKEGIFGRERVVQSVVEWAEEVTGLYDRIEVELGSSPDLSFERSRSVIMSEELMQKFAVPDRELPVLDIIRQGEAIASLVPRARWVLGSSGRVDLISPTGTTILVLVRENGGSTWHLVDMTDRRRTQPLDRAALQKLVAA